MNASASSSKEHPALSVEQNRAAGRSTRKTAARLTGYLAAGVGAGIVGTSQADAGVVQIDIGSSGFNIGGINAGVAPENSLSVASFPFSGAGSFTIYNNNFSRWGFEPANGLVFAAGTPDASPTRFAAGQTIGGSAAFTNSGYKTVFRDGSSVSPNFGAGSYMGFRTAQNNYGWLEVTWNGTSNEFQILSGAYESTPNTAISAAAVPEPSTVAMGGVAALALGAGAIRRARKARKESAAAV